MRAIYFTGKLNPKATFPLQKERNNPPNETPKKTIKNKIRRYIFSTNIRKIKKSKTGKYTYSKMFYKQKRQKNYFFPNLSANVSTKITIPNPSKQNKIQTKISFDQLGTILFSTNGCISQCLSIYVSTASFQGHTLFKEPRINQTNTTTI